MTFLRNLALDSDSKLAKNFMPHQVAWIQAEKRIHNQRKQAVALAEKSVRIGWTYADGFKNVRKRLWFKGRDYLFATKDYPSALEYVRQCYKFAEIFNLTRSIVSHGEENLPVNRPDENGRPTSFTDDVKVGVIKFDNGSRIIAFSANPQAMSVYGGDVGLDEFAKHPNARVLWETAQARVTWNYDLAIWSSHDGEDTLFNEFAREARAAWLAGQAWSPLVLPPADTSPTEVPITLPLAGGPGVMAAINSQPSNNPPIHQSSSPPPHGPWNLYFRVTLPDAIQQGLVKVINSARGTTISPAQFLADCRARSRDEEIFEQSYMCNPRGCATNHIVEASAIARCGADYQIERVHLEADEVRKTFGEFTPYGAHDRESQIHQFLLKKFPALLAATKRGADAYGLSPSNGQRTGETCNFQPSTCNSKFRLGFDVAASGQGDLAAIYIDEAKGDELWLRALFTCRTEDWHFLKTVLFYFLKHLPNLQAAGDESGLGRQICWEAAKQYSSRFLKVNFSAKKYDLGFALMNQLSVAEKRFPKSEADIAADYFALRKTHTGTRWAFSEGRNTLNTASHCDIAWAGALATHAHTERRCTVGAAVGYDTGWSDENGFHPYKTPGVTLTPEQAMLLSDDPRIWKTVHRF